MFPIMQKYSIIFINVAISLLITGTLMLMTDGTSRHGYEDAIIFAFLCAATLSLQLLVNLGIAIYFFVKKDKEKANLFFISMAILVFLALVPVYLIGFWD